MRDVQFVLGPCKVKGVCMSFIVLAQLPLLTVADRCISYTKEILIAIETSEVHFSVLLALTQSLHFSKSTCVHRLK